MGVRFESASRRNFFDDGLDTDVAAAVRDGLAVFEKLGATIKSIRLEHIGLSVPVYYVVAPAEASSNLSRYDGVRFGHRAENVDDLLDLYKRSRGEGFGAEVKRRILTGTYVLSTGYYDAYYLQAQKVRQLIAGDFTEAFADVDLVVGPTTPTPAFGIGQKVDDPIQMYLNDIYTIGANLAGVARDVDTVRPRRRLTGRPAARRPAPRRGTFTEGRALLSTRDRLASPGALRFRVTETAVDWEIVIGLEIHAQLATQSKIFSGAATAYGAPPNTQACLVDLGYPGVLPVLNEQAVVMAIKFGLATHCEIATRSVFARKNYFYPDLPKGYQISQYELPIVHSGHIDIPTSQEWLQEELGSRARTSRKTPANRCTKIFTASRASI